MLRGESRENRGIIDADIGSSNDFSNPRFRIWYLDPFSPFASYFPSSDADGLSLSAFDSNQTAHQSNMLHTFIHYFVYMTNNDMLDEVQVMKGLKFLLRTFESTFLPFLLGLNSVPMKIFMRKIFPFIVSFGNIGITKAIIDTGIDMSKYRHPSHDFQFAR